MDIVSYHTPDGTYARYAETLAESCRRHGIALHVEVMASAGDWLKNERFKAGFVYRSLMALKRPIVWCDIDCEVISYPMLFDEPGYDFMAYNWHGDPEGNQGQRYEPDSLASAGGVLYFGYTPGALGLLYHWVQACRSPGHLRDDELLDRTFKRLGGCKALRCRWLPKAYNRMDSHWPGVQPVINHVFKNGAIFNETPGAT